MAQISSRYPLSAILHPRLFFPSRLRLRHQLFGRLEQLHDLAQGSRRRGAVDHAVVCRERQRQQLAHAEHAVVYDDALARAADAEDPGLWVVDDRRSEAAGERAEIADGECRSRELVRRDRALAGGLGDLADLAA